MSDSSSKSQRVRDFPLKDKIVLVTGGGSGINFAFVTLANAAGAKVIIADLALTEVASQLVNSSNGLVVFQQTDVTDWKALKACFDVSLEKFSDVPDIVCNGAGIFEPAWSNWYDDHEDEDYACVKINLSALMKLTRMAMKAMVSHHKKGVILNVASAGGLIGSYTAPMYVATKHAVVGFTKSLDLADHLEGIKVVAACPGAVKTPLWTSNKDNLMKLFEGTMMLSVHDVAKAMMELVEKPEYPGGTSLRIMMDPQTGVVQHSVVGEYDLFPVDSVKMRERVAELANDISPVAVTEHATKAFKKDRFEEVIAKTGHRDAL